MPDLDDSALLQAYAPDIRAAASPQWADQSLRILRSSGLRLVSLCPAEAEAYLIRILAGSSPANRNRYRSVFSRFCKWAEKHGGPRNPFADTKALKERDAGLEIAHLSRQERDEVLGAAEALPDAMAVWLGLYAGLRRQEIWRVEARQIDLRAGKLLVLKSKTGVRRTVPIARALARRLARERLADGRAVPWPDTYWPMCDAEHACIVALRERLSGKVPAERIGWTVFRHTFGSLLAQAGVSLDKISAWMGNSPAVCRAHYAQFVPRDQRDEEIDRL